MSFAWVILLKTLLFRDNSSKPFKLVRILPNDFDAEPIYNKLHCLNLIETNFCILEIGVKNKSVISKGLPTA